MKKFFAIFAFFILTVLLFLTIEVSTKSTIAIPKFNFERTVRFALSESQAQLFVDQEDCAAYWGNKYIGDHAYQDFDIIEQLEENDVVIFNNATYEVKESMVSENYWDMDDKKYDLYLCTCYNDTTYTIVGLDKINGVNRLDTKQ